MPIQPTPDGPFRVGFCWVGDLDGDGEYDFVIVRQNPVRNQNQYLEAFLIGGPYFEASRQIEC